LSASLAISLDAMGGDNAPEMVVRGADIARRRFPQSRYLFFGDEARVRPLIDALPELKKVSTLRHTVSVVTMEDKPSQALRSGRGSSMRLAIDAVHHGEADAIVSAGNTGALLTAAHLKLRTLEGVDRPALACLIPAPENVFVLMDAGANLEPHPSNLVQYAIMGSRYSQQILGYRSPRVAVFSIGTEEMKGNELTLEAYRLLKKTDLNFVGNVDGHDLFGNKADVIITDAFVGNAVLKAAESTVRLVARWLKDELKKNPVRMLGAALASGAFKSLKERADPDTYGGAVLLGINGICIKAHGASSPKAIKNAIRVATEFVETHFNAHIVEDIRKFNDKFHQNTTAQPAVEAAN